ELAAHERRHRRPAVARGRPPEVDARPVRGLRGQAGQRPPRARASVHARAARPRHDGPRVLRYRAGRRQADGAARELDHDAVDRAGCRRRPDAEPVLAHVPADSGHAEVVARPRWRVTKPLRERIAAGHPWIYDRAVTGSAAAGELVTLVDDRGPLATALADPGSPIRARVLDRDPDAACDGAWARERARAASARRTRD